MFRLVQLTGKPKFDKVHCCMYSWETFKQTKNKKNKKRKWKRRRKRKKERKKERETMRQFSLVPEVSWCFKPSQPQRPWGVSMTPEDTKHKVETFLFFGLSAFPWHPVTLNTKRRHSSVVPSAFPCHMGTINAMGRHFLIITAVPFAGILSNNCPPESVKD